MRYLLFSVLCTVSGIFMIFFVGSLNIDSVGKYIAAAFFDIAVFILTYYIFYIFHFIGIM